ncbi:hypothetical protein [Bacteroides acidifaciens]|uniref:hypothetical protein n=1 Tax=Bacteroides acidifaciens TaxID=85831 RepID=UPI0026EB388A|nr:hypothetical protein [Bacteroides acidifaciens]
MSGTCEAMTQIRNAMAEGTNWSLFQRYTIEVSGEWIRTVGNIYPTLELDSRDGVVSQLHVPDGVAVKVRWKNINPWALCDNIVTIDVFDMYNDYSDSYKAVVWVPRKLALQYADSRMTETLEESDRFFRHKHFDRLCPEDMIWDMETCTWKLMECLNGYLGDERIGTVSHTCTTLHPLVHAFEGKVPTCKWIRRELSANPNPNT